MANKEEVDRPKELDDLVNLFDRTTKYIDDHLQEFRYGIYGLAAVGTILTIRGLRVFARFKRAKDIPRNYISKNVTLQGIVRRVDPESRALLVEHEPWVRLWRRNVRPDSLLPVSMGGVRMGGLGYQWLDLTMRDQRVDFTLLAVSPNNEAECIVKSTEGILRNRCLNSEAVRLGFGQVSPLNQRLSKNQKYMKFYRQLLKMEAKALSDHNGMWSATSKTQSFLTFYTKLWRFIEDVVKLAPRIKNRFSTKKALA